MAVNAVEEAGTWLGGRMKAISFGLGILVAVGMCTRADAEASERCPVPEGYTSVALRSELPEAIREALQEGHLSFAMPGEAFHTNMKVTDGGPSTGLLHIWKNGTHWVVISENGFSNTFGLETYEFSSDGKTVTLMDSEGAASMQKLCGEAMEYANWAASHDVDVFASIFFDLDKCPVPHSFRAVVKRSDLPAVLKEEFKGVAMPDESFNETDVGAPGAGLKLAWTDGRHWIVVLAIGGIAESFGVHDYDVNRDGTMMSELTPADLPFGTCRVALDEAKQLGP